jgi:hypothetical protein
MDKNYDQKIFILLGFFIEKLFKFDALINVLKPALVVEFGSRQDSNLLYARLVVPAIAWRSKPIATRTNF